MKKIKSILLSSFVLACPLLAVTNSQVSIKDKPAFLALVVDTSSCSQDTWRDIKAVAKEAIVSLKPGDRLELFSARAGKPILHINTIIRPADVTGYGGIYGCLSGIQQEFFLFKANLYRPMELIFEDFNRFCDSYQCLLFVVTDGRHDKSKINHIRRIATAFRSRKWLVLITATKQANKMLFLAAANREFDLGLLNEVNPAGWLKEARAETTIRAGKPESIKHITDSNDIAPADISPPKGIGIPKAQGLSELADSIDDGETRYSKYLLPVYPVPQTRPTTPSVNDVNALKKPQPPEDSKARTKPEVPVSKRYRKVGLALAGILSAALMILLAYIAYGYLGGYKASDLMEQQPQQHKPYHLMADSNDEILDLGEMTTINHLAIGSNPASAIPITDEDVPDKQLEIKMTRKGLQIKNTAEQPILINSMAINKGQKEDLVLPATIELKKNLKFRLFQQLPEEQDTEIPIGDFENEELQQQYL